MAWLDSLSGLVNSLSGLGGARDKGAAGAWYFVPMDDNALECAYRSSWMARSAVDIPAFDMVRAGWKWNAERDQAAKINALQKKLKIKRLIFEAQSAARLYGGAGIIISDGAADVSKPLDPERIGAGGLKFLTVMSRRYLIAGDIDRDPMSEGYLEPVSYSIATQTGAALEIHPSRVARFEGNRVPDLLINAQSDRWSDSVLDAVDSAIRDATAGQQGIAALIQEAKTDVIKVPGLTEKIATADYETRLMKRFTLMGQMKSIVNAVVIDGGEEWEQKTINFAGVTDAERLLIQIVSGAVDIPATRFLGQSPDGMNATGEGDLRNYYDRLSAEQELTLEEPLSKILDVVVRSAIGNRPEEIDFEFEPLWQLSEKEQAEVGKLEAETDRLHVTNGTVPMPALETAVQNRLIEGGQYPGLDQALEDFEASGEEDDRMTSLAGEEDDDDDEGGDDKAGGSAVTDAKPRTLYVRRNLLNGADLIAWAKGQGFETTLPEKQLHVTLIFSRTPVDWLAMGQDWTGEASGEVVIQAGGPRIVEPLGPNGAVTLMFASSALSWRHEDFKRNGAASEWPDYQPHVTITWRGGPPDLDQVEPYRGELRFGPEIFEEVDDEFREKIVET